MSQADLRELARQCTNVRLRVLEQVEVAGAGHYGSSLSLVELLVTLYHRSLRVRPAEPDWPGRDRFILARATAARRCTRCSPRWASSTWPNSTRSRAWAACSATIPIVARCPESTSPRGSLGHGLSVGVGMAQAIRLQDLGGKVVVLIGDGEQNEGQVWEAAGYAAARRLGNLMAVCDQNGVQVDGTTEETLPIGSLPDKWAGVRLGRGGGRRPRSGRAGWRPGTDSMPRGSRSARPPSCSRTPWPGRGIPPIEGDAAWHVGYLHGPDVDAAVDTIRAVHGELLEGASR